MAELIETYDTAVRTKEGATYTVRACGEEHEDVWHGWLEFVPRDGGAVLRTDRETSQPDRSALAYWASGLEPLYFEGAFDRALRAAAR